MPKKRPRDLPPHDLQVAGRRLIELREALGLTQAQLARMADVLPQSLSYWEQGRNRPGIDAAFRLSAATGGVPVHYFWVGDTRGMPVEVLTALTKYRRQQGQKTA